MMAVTFQHPTPYFDDSYAVNSANNGPYGDALLQELIPYLEAHFRIIGEPYARLLTGGSTGGWESLALQLYHPDFFGGTWTFFPDPIDFHKYQLVNIYEDPNAFTAPGYDFLVPRASHDAHGGRTDDSDHAPDEPARKCPRKQGPFGAAVRSLGSGVRSGRQRRLSQAACLTRLTGKIDHEVANYMRDHGFDLTLLHENQLARNRPEAEGQINVYVGDMDNFYLNLAVYLFEDFMKTTDAGATFDYGRPMKGHGWHPMSNAELVKMMAAQVTRNKP